MAQASIQAPTRKPEIRTASLRRVFTRTKGLVHGPVTRLFSPGDLGERIKPFVFLDHFDFRPTGNAMFPMHPHSGIATLTLLLSGAMRYEDTTGAHGELPAGSLEWLQAGGGVWHDASPIGTIGSTAISCGWRFRRRSKAVRHKANICRRTRSRTWARPALFLAVTPVP